MVEAFLTVIAVMFFAGLLVTGWPLIWRSLALLLVVGGAAVFIFSLYIVATGR